MGKASMVTQTTTTTTTTTKKKKGRPSLVDLQNRALLQRQQQQQQLNPSIPNPHFPQNPNRRSRSTRRTPNLQPEFTDGSDFDEDDDEQDDDDERVEKKVKLVGGFPNGGADQFPNSSLNCDDINAVAAAAEEEKGTRTLAPDPTTTSTAGAAATTRTPLPDKKLLLLILDKLQKKDTRGVFAEPVDPEELPDYHEVIEHPMDFSTVRKKLVGGVYSILEQLEADINLICSNAMEYNASSTIFFRQARSIQELAKKEFEALRQDDGRSEPPPRPRRGRPPGSRNLKKILESSSLDHGVPESSPEATPASRDDDAARSNNYNLRKGPSMYRFPRNLETFFDSPASASRSVSTKYGNKQYESDDSKRETYNLSGQFDSGQDPSFLTMFGGIEKQLTPVGIDCNYSYARSLAQFAVDLGPVVWRIVSKKIKSVLPPGVEFGPGWVGENKAAAVSSTLPSALPEKPDCVVQDAFKSESRYPSTSGFTNPSFAGNERLVEARGLSPNSEWSSLKGGVNGVMGPSSSLQIQRGSGTHSQVPVIHSGLNGFSGGFGSGFQFQEGMTRPTSSSFNPLQTPESHPLDSSSLEACKNLNLSRMHMSPIDIHGATMITQNDLGAHGMPYWQNVSAQGSWDRPYTAEPNMGFQNAGFQNRAPSSRTSSLPIGSPPQLDLVLQL